jgi:hypothetical protein
MNAPQVTMIVLFALCLFSARIDHGKPRTGTHNFWVALICDALLFAVLWWGGFWK